MGLLNHNLSNVMQSVAQAVYEAHLHHDPEGMQYYDDVRKARMLEDVMHNTSFLEVAMRLKDESLFTSYASWLYTLLVHHMQDVPKTRVRDQLVRHYDLLIEALEKVLDQATFERAKNYLEKAKDLTKTLDIENPSQTFLDGPYALMRETYLDLLQNATPREVIEYVRTLINGALSLDDLYGDMLQPVMHEIGILWQTGRISVDEEHYMTSITQTVLAQFYDRIFEKPRQGKTMVACTVGSELHEMGARMVSDLFENHGWDSIYLGAAVPLKALLGAVEKHRPHLVALSVTMPQYLTECKAMVEALKKQFPDTVVAIGGQAFTMSSVSKEMFGADIHEKDAKAFIEKAEAVIR